MKKSLIYPILATLLLAAVAFLFFAPDDFKGNVLQQHDIQQGLANGHEAEQFRLEAGSTPRWTNALFSGMPTFQIAPTYEANKLLDWILPVYSLGLPSPANLLFILFAGFFIMCLCLKFRWYTALFAAVAWGFSTYFIIIIGAGHIWKFLTLAYIPPTIGGIALLYRGKYLAGTALTALFATLQLHSNHPQMTYYFIFPVIFILVAWLILAIRTNTLRKWLIASACTLGAALLAVGANSASLYNSLQYSKETVRGRATDIQTPGSEQSGMDRSAVTAWSYGKAESFSLLIPNVKGGATIKPVGGSNQLLSVADTDEALNHSLSPEEYQVLRSFPQYFGDQPMTNGPVYVGAFILLLAILAMWTVRDPNLVYLKWALAIAAIISLILSWGHNNLPFNDWIVDYFPLYNKFRAPASALVVFEFSIPLLAALCVASMVKTPGFLDLYKKPFFIIFGLGALVCVIGWLAPSVFGNAFSDDELAQLQPVINDPAYANVLAAVRASRLSLVSADSLRSLLYIIVAFAVIWLYVKGAFKNAPLFVCCLTVVTLIDLFNVNKRYVNSDNFAEPLPQSELFEMSEADRQILQDTTDYRVLDLQDFSGARSSYFHKTIGGYHAAKLTRYNDLITHAINPAMERLMRAAHDNAQSQRLNPDSIGNPRLFTPDQPVLNMLNTKYYLYGDYAEENPHALGNAWFVDSLVTVNTPAEEMTAIQTVNPATTAVVTPQFREVLLPEGPLAPAQDASIRLTHYSPDKMVYTSASKHPGVAVFSEVFFPWGWTATIDGTDTPIARVDYTLRAIRIPAGNHTVTFTFHPKALDTTNTIGVVCVILTFLLCLAALIFTLRTLPRKP